MAANSLDTTTYNEVAANTVFDAVLDAAKILAWRNNVKSVVDQHATEIDGKVGKTGTQTMAGPLGIGLAPGGGVLLDIQNASSNTFLRAYSSGADTTPTIQIRNDAQIYNIKVDGSDSDKFKIVNGGGSTLFTLDTTGNLTSTNIKRGTGSPEGVVTGTVGDLFLRTDGGTSTTLYVKQSGTGNTGWIAK